MKKLLIVLSLFFISVSIISAIHLYSSSTYSVDELLENVQPGNQEVVKVRGVVTDLRTSEQQKFYLVSANGNKLPVLLEPTKDIGFTEGEEVIVEGRFTVEQVFIGREVK